MKYTIEGIINKIASTILVFIISLTIAVIVLGTLTFLVYALFTILEAIGR